jgi:hypothetical protein
MHDDGYIPGPKVKLTDIKWYKESLSDTWYVNNPLKKVGSAISNAVTGSYIDHEFIVVSYDD